MDNYVQVAKELAKKLANMDISGGGLGAEVGHLIQDYDIHGSNGSLSAIIKKLNLKDNQKSDVATFIKNHKLLQDANILNIDSLIDNVLSGKDANVLMREALGPTVTAPDQTAVSIDTQKRTPTTTTNPKGPLSMPVDVGSYPIDPQDAVKILFFKLAAMLEPFSANLIAFYPETEDVHYKVQDFISNSAEKINTVITGMKLANYESLAWVAFAYVSEQAKMPLLRNVLIGDYAGEYWLPAYGNCVYKDEDGISSDRFDSDYRTYRSMINEYGIEDLIKFSSVGGGVEKVVPEMTIPAGGDGGNTVGAAETKTEDNDSVLDNQSTYALATELGLSVDDAIQRIKDATTKEVEGFNPIFKSLSVEDIKNRLFRYESSPIASRVFYKEEIKSLKDELKIREEYNTGISMEIDPSKDVDPNEDKPFKDDGAAPEPEKAAMAIPASLGTEINKAIDMINNSEGSPEEIVDSMVFNLSGAHPEEKNESMTFDQYLNQNDPQKLAPGSVVLKDGDFKDFGKTGDKFQHINLTFNGKTYSYVIPLKNNNRILYPANNLNGSGSVFKIDDNVKLK